MGLLLAAEIMGNVCAAFNRLGKHGEALHCRWPTRRVRQRSTHAGRQGVLQPIAVYHNRG